MQQIPSRSIFPFKFSGDVEVAFCRTCFLYIPWEKSGLRFKPIVGFCAKCSVPFFLPFVLCNSSQSTLKAIPFLVWNVTILKMNYGFILRAVKTSDFFLLLRHVKDPKTTKKKGNENIKREILESSGSCWKEKEI